MKRQFIRLALSLCTALSAFAVPITFQLDLGPRMNTGEFIPGFDQVVVRGSFNNWTGGVNLTPLDETSTIYTGTADVTGDAGSTVEFKFVQLRPDTGDAWETSPNRAFPLPTTATTLPVSYFNNVWEGAPIPVKFQVNMATQLAANAFDPANGDFVEVRGSFNNWSGSVTLLAPSAENPDIYEWTAEIPDAPGSRVEYKFVINQAKPDATTTVVWENDPNRSFMQTAEPQELPVVYFNNVTGTAIKAAINFQADLSVYIEAGLFDTNTQEVYIRGNKPDIGWEAPPAEGFQLFPDASRPGIYTNLYLTDSQITGDRVEYKVTLWTPETLTTTWEDGANKTLTFAGTEPENADGYHEIVIEPAYFNGVEPGTLLNEETVVTFQVDMNGARTTAGAAFDPTVDIVALNGAFLTGGWQPWESLFETQAFDDGASGGDTTADDGIYSLQLTLPRGTPSRLVYKYGINGADNEAAIGNDRIRFVRETGAYTMPVDTFGDMIEENLTEEIGTVAITRANAGEVTINWTGQPGVRLQKLDNLQGDTVTDLPTTDGQSTYTAPASGQMGFFRLVKP